ncbi:hypothetical protein FIBSPDRAFT_956350 [Athelia psychrophila]|uniref:Uncharacterized protein n=1 Tax=Athelia psychrophila TaxID=1759441 RepID=A0A166H0U5_9AGAM|nr:hypothetical protein FIBSPDRAFT_956350 [Fibularhizoctonia sp. CBS 109695]
MLGQHGDAILIEIRARQPELVKDFALVTEDVLATEGFQLARFLRPDEGCSMSEVLEQFSLERNMSEAESIAPSLCEVLHRVITRENTEENASSSDLSCMTSSLTGCECYGIPPYKQDFPRLCCNLKRLEGITTGWLAYFFRIQVGVYWILCGVSLVPNLSPSINCTPGPVGNSPN